MKELQIFNSNEFGEIRILNIEGKEYAVGNDIARALKYAEPHKAVTNHCKGGILHPVLTSGGMQETKVIPIGDIYRLIVKAADQSQSEDVRQMADKFERWIFDEVLPSIHKTGKYELPNQLTQVDTIANNVRALGWHETPTNRKQRINEELSKLRQYYYDLVDQDVASEPEPMGIFLQDCCIINQDSIVERTPLYDSYVRWSCRNNVYPKSKAKLTKFLDDREDVAYLKPDNKHGFNARFMGIELNAEGLRIYNE